MNKWISVKDRLPENDETVLVYNSDWETDYHWEPDMSPTHWMLLPEPPMNEWISVKEKLPENDETVLVYNPKDGISTGEFHAEEISFYIETDGSNFYTHDGWETDYSWAPYMSPTHWMPLPEAPHELMD